MIYGVEIKILRRVLLIASSSTPSTRHPTHWLISTQIIKMVVVRCVKTVMSTNGFTNIKMGLGAAGNQIGAGIAGGANAVNNTAARGLLNMGQTTGKQVNARLKGKEAVADSLVIVCHSAKHLPAGHKKRPAAYLKIQVGKKGAPRRTRPTRAFDPYSAST